MNTSKSRQLFKVSKNNPPPLEAARVRLNVAMTKWDEAGAEMKAALSDVTRLEIERLTLGALRDFEV